MKTFLTNLLASIAFIMLTATAICAAPSCSDATPGKNKTPLPASAAFARFKALEGEWQGKTARVVYRVIANGSAVVEEMMEGRATMITVYHLDGPDRLMLTHYCAAGNQPRMRTGPIQGNPATLKFEFLDITNLAAPTAPYMRDVEFQFRDADHFTTTWTFSGDGKMQNCVFAYERKKH